MELVIPDANDGDLTHDQRSLHPEDSEFLDLKGRPVDRSKTGTWKAAGFFYGLTMAEGQASIGLYVNLITYLVMTMHLTNSDAATQVTNLIGSAFLLSILGGFLADSYLGGFYTIVVGGVMTIVGLGLLIISVCVLEPPQCTSLICAQASTRYLAPLFTALYTIAVGAGLVTLNLVSLGADQFDDLVPTEKQQQIHFFTWYYFSVQVLGLGIAFTLGVYLQDNVSRGWGYGFCLMFYFTFFFIFLLGTPRIRHRRPAGSFLTRMAQVLVASLRKLRTPIPEDVELLYSPSASTGKSHYKLSHTNTLRCITMGSIELPVDRISDPLKYVSFLWERFLDRAAITDANDKGALAEAKAHHHPDPWRLCSVTQVEESKRLIQLIPIWMSTIVITLIYAQLSTFTVQQGVNMDRRLGPHFVIPPGALPSLSIISGVVIVPIYDRILIPITRRYTGIPYGMTPLTRIGIGLVFAVLTMLIAALVERKRLTYVRELQLEALPLGGPYALPMEFWWLLPQYFCSGVVELFFYVAAYEFFYHESAGTTRSVGSSFTFSSASLGFFLSSVLVDIVNSATHNNKGGPWLKGQLNNGGLENFYWLLAVVIFVGYLAFLVFAYFYQYKHDWYHIGGSSHMQDVAKAEDSKEVD